MTLREVTPNVDFDRAFNPRSIAIVGVSRKAKQQHNGNSGIGIVHSLRRAGYQGHVYPVNPNANDIEGMRVYPSLRSIPDSPDLVVIAVPAAAVPTVIEECAAIGALNVHVCSSGFTETGEQESRSLEDKIRQVSLSSGMRLLGPNCMGIQVPRAGICTFSERVQLKDGPVAFLSQSGGHAFRFMQYGPMLGVGFSTIVSYGNALVTDLTDFLDYFASDNATKVICIYLEGVRNGSLLVRLVKRINLLKPVLVYKGGNTISGARAAASHTGSLAGNFQIWESFFKQTGAVPANSIEELAEASAAFISLPPRSGKRAVVITGGGGNNVAAGDICAAEGIQLLPLSDQTRSALRGFLTPVNQGLTNPLEAPDSLVSTDNMTRALRILYDDPKLDIIILNLIMGPLNGGGPQAVNSMLKTIAMLYRENLSHKPLVLAMSDPMTPEASMYLQQLQQAGLLWYPSMRQAARAISRFTSYHRLMEEMRKGELSGNSSDRA